MTKFILHGGYTRQNSDSFFQELINDTPNMGKILSVYFACEIDAEIKFLEEVEKIKRLSDGREIYIDMANESNFVEQLKESDVVYIRGGNTELLKSKLAKYSEFSELIKGKTVAGSSAGAYVLSKYYYANSLDEVREGLGLVPVRVVCHYESNIHPKIGDSDPVKMLDDFDSDIELVLLKDFEWKVFEL
ncbi:Type 1 glutamine amidotransferase-like domain-containing protein [Candidatus Nomurabacteria bacterium]|nr:Type 1 glutamine amidotransferase-like domain-containing protein [Candidatus Kaiserbacteria bacterium]MCB9815739.1 Type 1 glutamine amidotransferase-like domain-containing protein [Candidatus Nomurabacteria bacterium]